MQTVHTDAAPGAVGPYSQAIKVQGFVYTAGQVGIDPAVGKMVSGDVSEQTRQVLKNLAAVLAEAGSGLDRVVKTTVYLADMADFQAMNTVYAEAFGGHRPARSTVAAAGLPLGARVEIDVVALG